MALLLSLCIVLSYALYGSTSDNPTQVQFKTVKTRNRMSEGALIEKDVLPDGVRAELDVSDPLISPFRDQDLFEDGNFWYVRNKHGTADRIIRRGEPPMLNTHDIVYAQTESASWCKFAKPPEKFCIYLKSLPLTREPGEKTYDNYRLSERQGRKGWLVRDDKGLFRKIVLQGAVRYNKDGIYYVRCDDDLWYKLKRPPGDFLAYLANIPELEQTPISDDLLSKKDNIWYVLNKFGIWKKVTSHNFMHSTTFRYNYARDEDGTWYKFSNPPKEFCEYLQSLPRVYRYSSNERLQMTKDGAEWMVCNDHDGLLKKLLYKDPKYFRIYGDMVYRAYDEDGYWHTFLNPSAEFVEWMSQLPVPLKSPKLWDNMRLVKGEGGEWKVKDEKGEIRKIDARGEPVGDNLSKRIFYARIVTGKWFKFRNPPLTFISYISTLRAIPRSPIWDDRLKCEDGHWFVVPESGKRCKIICQNARNTPISRYKYACDTSGTWFKFQNPADEFLQYLETLPTIRAQYDTSRLQLSKDGKTLWIYSKRNGQLKTLREKRLITNIKNSGLNVVHLCDEEWVWYTFVSPPKPIFDWIKANLPDSCVRKKVWNNDRLVECEAEWKVRDKNGTLRKIDGQGDTVHNERNIYYISSGTDWFKVIEPPKKFIPFVHSLPIKQRSPLADSLVQKRGKFWYILNDSGELRRLITRNHLTKHLYCIFVKDEDGVWYKFRNLPSDFIAYCNSLPRAWTGTDNGRLLQSENSYDWLVRQNNGVAEKLLFRGSQRTNMGTVTQVAYDSESKYYFIDPPKKFLEWVSGLPKKTSNSS